ncbi:MAG: TolB family protein, partial [Longimicrobiales bacterium]
MVIGGAAAAFACSDPVSVRTPVAPRPQLPDWSIAFETDREGAPHIYVANVDGSQATRFVWGGAPALSSDGTRLAFHRAGSGAYEGIYVIDADGSNER